MTAALDEIMRSWKRPGREDAEHLSLGARDQLTSEERRTLVAALLEALDSQTRDTRVPRALVAFPGPEVQAGLRRALAEAEAGERPLDAASVESAVALVRVGGPVQESQRVLVAAVKDGTSVEARVLAVLGLRALPRSPASHAALRAAVDDPHPSVRLQATAALPVAGPTKEGP